MSQGIIYIPEKKDNMVKLRNIVNFYFEFYQEFLSISGIKASTSYYEKKLEFLGFSAKALPTGKAKGLKQNLLTRRLFFIHLIIRNRRGFRVK